VSTKSIAVVGTGANGAGIAADLTLAGLDVTLIDQWPAHVEKMRADGLRIEMPDRRLEVAVRAHHLCDVATFTRQFDVVLLLVKAYDTPWACQLIEPYVKPDGLVVGVQNGMTADVVAGVMGSHRTMGSVIEVSSTMYEPGIVERHTPPSRSWFAVGAMDAATAGREEEIAELLRHSGTVAVVDDIRSAKWMKLVSNACTMVTTAILGLSMLDTIRTPGMRELMLRCGREALETGIQLGHQALPIFGLTPDDIQNADTIVEVMLDKLYANFVLPHTTTTILQDWTKGRHSEVDDLNGLVVAEAARIGSEAATNAALVALAHSVERGELQPGLDNLPAFQELADGHVALGSRFHPVAQLA
jgi:2-dehydropantoate 2-reductase